MNTASLRLIKFLILIVILSSHCPSYAGDSTLRITAVGDIMMGSTYPEAMLPPDDGAGIFDGVKASLGTADIVFGNLEGPLTDSGKSEKCGKKSRMCFAFSTPTRYAPYLKDAGFNVLNVANNHALDFGPGGIKSTANALAAASLAAIGGGRVETMNIRGKRVTIAGFSFSSPAPYSVNDIDAAAQVVKDLKAASDIVIISFHGGAEGKSAVRTPDTVEYFAGEQRGNVVAFSHAMIDAGADLILGHGPHVLRALDLYKGKLIVYSLGNFLTYGRFNIRDENGISMVLHIELNPDTGDFMDGSIIPVKLVGRGIPQMDPDRSAISVIKDLSAKDTPGNDLRITASGELQTMKPDGHDLDKTGMVNPIVSTR